MFASLTSFPHAVNQTQFIK